MDHGQNGGVDGGRVDQGLVALDIDDNLGIYGGGCFGHTVRTGKVIGARHTYTCSEIFCGGIDALIIGGNENAREVGR